MWCGVVCIMCVVCVVVVECVGCVEYVVGGCMCDGVIGGGYGMEVFGVMFLYVKSIVMFLVVWNIGYVYEMLLSRSMNGLSGLGLFVSGFIVFLF